MSRTTRLLPLVALLSIVAASPAYAMLITPTDPGRRCAWPIAYPGASNYAFPDTAAAYFVEAAVLDVGDEIVVTGRQPDARYWSLQTYRYSDSSLLDSVNDATVRRSGTGTQRKWTVRVVPPTRDSGKDPNVLRAAGPYDGEHFGSNITVVMFRVYVSGGANPAGGPLPAITLRYARDGAPVSEPLPRCAPEQVGLPENRPMLSPAQGVGPDFVRAPGGSFYPSADTAYLVAQAEYRPNQVLVITGKAPRAPRDVRYWSICQNVNEGDLPVVGCVRDDEVILDSSRRYTVAVASKEQVPAVERQNFAGVTFLDWGEPHPGYSDAFLIYRNILARRGFSGAVNKVPLTKPAKEYLGEYAPRLQWMSLDDFRSLRGP